MNATAKPYEYRLLFAQVATSVTITRRCSRERKRSPPERRGISSGRSLKFQRAEQVPGLARAFEIRLHAERPGQRLPRTRGLNCLGVGQAEVILIRRVFGSFSALSLK